MVVAASGIPTALLYRVLRGGSEVSRTILRAKLIQYWLRDALVH